MSDTILCPKCKCEIEVTEVLSSQLRAELQKQFDAEQRARDAEFAKREVEIKRLQQAVAVEKSAIDDEVASRLEKEKQRLTGEALEKARESVAVELKDVQAQLDESKVKLLTAQQAELELRKSKRELEEAKRELEVTVARKLDEEREKIRETAKKEAADERQLKDAEKDKLIADLRSQTDDLRRKLEQGSQQTQGEVLELELESWLRQAFPYDTITSVPKGVFGGDVVQNVRDSSGSDCGTILWESKRTKNWSDGWLPKLRDDQRAAKAQIAVLVSIELPKGIKTFECIDGIWVTCRDCSLGLASALRSGLIQIAATRRSQDGKSGKMEMLYGYLSGPEFRHRVEGIVESFATLKEDLESEKRAMHRTWAKREKQLERAITNTSGMYGDLSGIIGASLPAIEQLTLPQLPSLSANGDGDGEES
jgi:hypothetical protein